MNFTWYIIIYISLTALHDEPSGIRHGGVRRMPPSGRGVSRARRNNMQFSTSGGISSLSPSSRDAVVDPIAELLSQLSGVRRGAQPGTPSQLQQLQMQLQLERQQANAARQQLERLPRRPAAASGASAPPPAPQPAAHPAPQPDAPDSQFLLAGFLGATNGTDAEEVESRAALLRGLMLSSLGPAAPAPPPPAPRAPSAPPAPAPALAPIEPDTRRAPPAQPPPRAKPQPRTKVPAPPDPPAVPTRPRPV
ncbi:unnamed protein product [Euphydryas editha]|uniref:Uncharacterized protein n=1 Tax=Euphydryas editha TaxID=104508 RepID=A0AAU9UC51_EUPED|nr:unnamed protein product [Euphydryas editha]